MRCWRAGQLHRDRYQVEVQTGTDVPNIEPPKINGLQKLCKEELRDIAKTRNLDTAGTKADIVLRILQSQLQSREKDTETQQTNTNVVKVQPGKDEVTRIQEQKIASQKVTRSKIDTVLQPSKRQKVKNEHARGTEKN